MPNTGDKVKPSLSESFPSSAPEPDGVLYSVWQTVNLFNAAILQDLLSHLLAFGYHLPTPKVANGMVLNKAGKVSYPCPASFRIRVLLNTLPKILEHVMTGSVSSLAHSRSMLCPNQWGCLPGLNHSDACLSLAHRVRTFQRLRLKVSTLFLDIKAGFDKFNASALRVSLLA